MSAKSGRLSPLVFAGLLVSVPVVAEDALPPDDMEFIEYLGTWAGSDEDWLALMRPDETEPEHSAADARNDESEDDEG